MDFLILHGWNVPANRYTLLSKLLVQKGYSVYTPNLPGFGGIKGIERPYKLDDYAEFVHKYIGKKKLHKPLIIAHSFGGRIAIRLLANYPDVASKAVFTGVPGFPTDLSLKVKLFRLIAKTGKPIAGVLFRGSVLRLVSKSLYGLAGNFDYYRANPLMKKTFQLVVNDSLYENMKKIDTKIYLVWGENDTITPLWIGEKMKKTLKNAELITVENADHGLPYKSPNKFIETLDTIIKL